MARQTEFVSVHLTPQARQALRLLAVDLGHKLRRPVSMSEAALHAAVVARNNPPLGGGETNGGKP